MELNTIQKREKLNVVNRVGSEGAGGAYHTYDIIGLNVPNEDIKLLNRINFQNGPRNVEGSTPGIIDTDLLEIVRDRLKAFQAGPYASEYNAKALEHIELALMYLNRRVEDRIERNVLGTNNK